MSFILDLWNQFTGAGLVEPTMFAYAMFVLIFIVIPTLTLYIGFKLLCWFLNSIRDWWHDGRK